MAAILIVVCKERDRQAIADAFDRKLKDGDVIFMPEGTKFHVARFGDDEELTVAPLSEAQGTILENGYHLAIEDWQLKVVKEP